MTLRPKKKFDLEKKINEHFYFPSQIKFVILSISMIYNLVKVNSADFFSFKWFIK